MSGTPWKTAVIVGTGDEIALGQLQDTNGRAIAQSLVACGISPIGHAAVPDDLDRLVALFRRLAEGGGEAIQSPDLVIMTGGLGPTDGDLTRAALAAALREPLVEDAGARAALEALLARRNRPVTERQLRQAQRPVSAVCLPNHFGTAPGLRVDVPRPASAGGGVMTVFALPGPPGEMRPMLEASVLPEVRSRSASAVLTRLLHVVGVPEAECVSRLNAAVPGITSRDRTPLLGITASGGVLTLRQRWEGAREDEPRGRALLDADRAAVRRELGASVFGEDETDLAAAVLEQLRRDGGAQPTERGPLLAVAESCTGGGLGEMLSAVPGASDVFAGGVIAYSNAVKIAMLGVPERLIAEHGAVSGPVAATMATGVVERVAMAAAGAGGGQGGAVHGLAITGVAGPGGGSAAKPVGTVWVAHACRAAGGHPVELDVRRFLFTGGRADVRERAARTALVMLHFALAEGMNAARRRTLLWEVGRWEGQTAEPADGRTTDGGSGGPAPGQDRPSHGPAV